VRWLDDEEAGGVRQRQFGVERAGRSIPGLLWTPTGEDDGRPLVLIGHGAGGSKRQDYVVALARRLVRHRRFAVAAIDGPTHGDRRADGPAGPGLAFLEFSQMWAGDPTMTDAMVEDWRSVLDELSELAEVGAGPVGYWGLSMGTILGLPLVAAEPRVGVAVLGLMGLTGPTRERIAKDAPAVTCPVLYLVQRGDEIFPLASALDLFDALGATDKRLHLQLGRHGDVPGEEFEASDAFLARHLSPRASGP
jgi:dienelactone hydrolase